MGTEYLDVVGGRLAYEMSGLADGPLVVCAHGMGDSRRTFRFLVPHLAGAGYRVAALNVRGYGESSPTWPSYVSGARPRRPPARSAHPPPWK